MTSLSFLGRDILIEILHFLLPQAESLPPPVMHLYTINRTQYDAYTTYLHACQESWRSIYVFVRLVSPDITLSLGNTGEEIITWIHEECRMAYEYRSYLYGRMIAFHPENDTAGNVVYDSDEHGDQH